MLQKKRSLVDLENQGEFVSRHIGPRELDQSLMLETLGYTSMNAFIEQVVPENIRAEQLPAIEAGCSEQQALAELQRIAAKNQPFKSLIGQGYHNCYTPSVILRNVLENPAWYTAYTPYQPEISQGRLEALLNFQTMICDLTGMDLANASMLDEATAAAEAMTLCKRASRNRNDVFFVDQDCLPQTIAVMQTRAEPLGIDIQVGDPEGDYQPENCFGCLLQYPGTSGELRDYREVISRAQSANNLAVMSADPLALVVLTSPGELGADVVIGSTQRFGVPLSFGGPHAAYMATRDKYKRSIPGRLVGVSVDSNGQPAYRLALQTREQHIRREKATSNICTAQALLAILASMYAVYHGPVGLRRIAERTHYLTSVLAEGLIKLGFNIENKHWFDTLTIHTSERTEAIHQAARDKRFNLRMIDESRIGLSLDETVSKADLETLWGLFSDGQSLDFAEIEASALVELPQSLLREDPILTHEVFNSYHSETEMLRYLRRLADKDIALDRSMIPLGSCTMKLNSTSEMLPITWTEFAGIHPLVPLDQAQGYLQLFQELEQMLSAVTGYDAVSLQPNAGSQGEYAGLLAIRAWQESRGEGQRNICLIPGSAHGTNPASAQMCGMKVVVVNCDSQGNVDLADLQEKIERHSDYLAAIMVTYPSTHGVFEERITEICDLVHEYGGQVYIDGANMNAMVGLCYPGKFGGDVSHLNLHKTFCIPHGGGGPGVGPIGVAKHLAPFLPGPAGKAEGGDSPIGPVSAATWGSAGILPISWMYLRMMGSDGLKQATENAILNANYIAHRLKDHFPVLYTGANGLVAHECILDLRPLKDLTGINVDDVAKRLIDFGFHAPTMSFPVPGTLMIEPTESESKEELDRFCEAMICIRGEIGAIERGELDDTESPLRHAPHTASVVCDDQWSRSYTREQAAYPLSWLRANKYWVPVARIDNVYGERNLVCSCPPMESYKD